MKVLIVLTSHNELGHTGEKTGFWAEEFAAPYYVLEDAGVEITIASPQGGQPPVDPKSKAPEAQTPATKRFNLDPALIDKLALSHKLSEINEADYDAVFYPGGHGPLWDLTKDKNSIHLIEDFYKHAAENKSFLDTMQAARQDPKSQMNILQRANGYDTVNFAADLNAMRNLQRMYHNIVDNPDISPSDKRQSTNEIADRLNTYAESANQRLYEQMVQAGKLKEERQKEITK